MIRGGVTQHAPRRERRQARERHRRDEMSRRRGEVPGRGAEPPDQELDDAVEAGSGKEAIEGERREEISRIRELVVGADERARYRIIGQERGERSGREQDPCPQAPIHARVEDQAHRGEEWPGQRRIGAVEEYVSIRLPDPEPDGSVGSLAGPEIRRADLPHVAGDHHGQRCGDECKMGTDGQKQSALRRSVERRDPIRAGEEQCPAEQRRHEAFRTALHSQRESRNRRDEVTPPSLAQEGEQEREAREHREQEQRIALEGEDEAQVGGNHSEKESGRVSDARTGTEESRHREHGDECASARDDVDAGNDIVAGRHEQSKRRQQGFDAGPILRNASGKDVDRDVSYSRWTNADRQQQAQHDRCREGGGRLPGSALRCAHERHPGTDEQHDAERRIDDPEEEHRDPPEGQQRHERSRTHGSRIIGRDLSSVR